MRRLLTVAALCTSIAACAPDATTPATSAYGARAARAYTSPQPTATPVVTLRLIRPSTANSSVDPKFDLYNVVALPVGVSKGKLFVFLPGTGAAPSVYEDILEQAAQHGFPAIALEYPNLPAVNKLCAGTTDPSCWGNIRDEIVTGHNTTRLVNVDRTNSISQRLFDLLAYLAAVYPFEGWDAFAGKKIPMWKRIIVSGDSQGGGYAAYIAKIHTVSRACYIEAPGDGNRFIPVARWVSQPGSTADALQYGFTNRLDRILTFHRVYWNWSGLGLAASPVDVDVSAPPYGRSHRLYTVVKVAQARASHDVTITDADTPIDSNGVPVYAPVWDYICFGAR